MKANSREARNVYPSGKITPRQCGNHPNERQSTRLPTHNFCPDCGRISRREEQQ